jgi:ABC-type transport system involved in multi-copper enzyme maturation permease subunit
MPVVLRWLLRLGPANPIAVRLVASGSRRQRHHYIRIAYLGLLIVVLLWWLLARAGGEELSLQQLAAAGSGSFQAIAFLQIGLICIIAPVFMAGAIAQEADPRTWDILLTTPLSPSQIVLGNLLGRLFFILALLLSSLPLFAVTQYFGGVPGETIFASYAVAAGAALLVGSIAIALSVSRLVGKRAVFAFYVAVVSYLAVTLAIDRVFGTGGVTWMTALNPFLALTALLDPTGYARAAPGTHTGLARWFLEHPVTTWCALASGLSVLLVAISALTVRFGGIAGAGGLLGRDGAAPRTRSPQPGAGPDSHNRRDGENETHRGPREVWRNPIAWREAAGRNATPARVALRYGFIAMGLVWACVAVGLYHAGTWNTQVFRGVLLATIAGELVVITLVSINMAATSVAREREDGTLDLLLTTPITPGQYLSGKLKGMIAWLMPLLSVPIGSALIAGLYVLTGGLGREGGVMVSVAQVTVVGNANTPATIEVPAVLPEGGLILALAAIPFVAMCVVIGMQWSLRSKGTLTAVSITVAIVGAVAGVLGLCAWQSAMDLPLVGPGVGALSPLAVTHAITAPEQALQATIERAGLGVARAGLLIGALVAAGAYAAVVYGVHAGMTKGFDFTVRKLAGMK